MKKDSLTGVQVNESKLGPINRARSARNADLFQGLDPTSFEKPTRIQVGRAISTQTAPAAILAWPEMGIAIQTDGDADDQAAVRVVSTRAAGAPDIKISVLAATTSRTATSPPAPPPSSRAATPPTRCWSSSPPTTAASTAPATPCS